MIVALVLLLTLVMSFLLSGMESALVAVSRVRVKHAAEEDEDPRAQALLALLNERESLLGVVTVANHLSNVASFGIIVWAIVGSIGPWGYAVACAIALPLFVVGLEVLPKTLCRQYPFRSLRKMLPLVKAAAWFSPLFRSIQRKEDVESSQAREEQLRDLVSLLDNMVDQRLMSVSTAKLMRRVLQFRGQQVANVIREIPRTHCITAGSPMADAMALAGTLKQAVLPVVDAAGNPISWWEVGRQNYAAARVTAGNGSIRLQSHTSALQALKELRRRGQSHALVQQGDRILGMVVEEDLLHLLSLEEDRAITS
jgi:CBS domain containing-hemolysin-like protein